MAGYALQQGEGRTYDWRGHLFTIKAAAAATDGRLAFWEFTTKKGDEPNDHVHDDVDEILYVLEGSLTVRCGDDAFDVGDNVWGAKITSGTFPVMRPTVRIHGVIRQG